MLLRRGIVGALIGGVCAALMGAVIFGVAAWMYPEPNPLCSEICMILTTAWVGAIFTAIVGMIAGLLVGLTKRGRHAGLLIGLIAGVVAAGAMTYLNVKYPPFEHNGYVEIAGALLVSLPFVGLTVAKYLNRKGKSAAVSSA